MGWGDPVVGGTVLRRPAIASPNFVHAISGWTINQDGSAEFANLTIRGTFFGLDFIVNSAGIFFYNGAPATGNLIFSVAVANGTDAFGNVYNLGMNIGNQQAAHFGTDLAGKLFISNASNKIVGNWQTSDGALLFYDSFGASLGHLVASISGVAGTDPSGNAYKIGMCDYLPGAGFAQLAAGVLAIGSLAGSSLVTSPFQLTFNDATVASTRPYAQLLSPLASNNGAAIQLLGESQDSSQLPKILMFGGAGTPQVPGALLEVQGSAALGSLTSAMATLSTDSSGALTMKDQSGLTQNVSGSALAGVGGASITNQVLTSIGFLTVPANDVEAGTAFEAHAIGTFSTGGVAPASALIGLWWGGVAGTQLATISVPAAGLWINAANASWSLDGKVTFTATGAGTARAWTTVRLYWRTAAGVGNSITWHSTNDTGAVLDTTVNKNLSMGFQWGANPGTLTVAAARFGRIA